MTSTITQFDQFQDSYLLKRDLSFNRIEAIKIISLHFPKITEINVPNKFSTDRLIQFANYIPYEIPYENYPLHLLNFVEQLTNFYYDYTVRRLVQQQINNDQSIQVSQIGADDNIQWNQSLSIIKDISQTNDAVTLIDTSLNILIDQQIKINRPQKNNRYSYSSVLQFMNSYKNMDQNSQKENVSSKIIDSVARINSWQKKHQVIELFNLSSGNKDKKWNRQDKKSIVIKLPDNNQLWFGINENQETKKLKQKLRLQANNNFIKIKNQQESNLSILEKIKINIHFQLNKISKQNINDIVLQISPLITGKNQYQYSCKQICLFLIDKIIEKCYTEHYRYISIYALLCQKLCKISKKKFNQTQYQQEFKNQSKGNPFKKILVKIIQTKFDKQIFSVQLSQTEKIYGTYRSDTIACVRFIGQLIKSNVLSKRIINISMATIILKIIKIIANYKFIQSEWYKQINQSYIEVYLEAMIRLIDTLGTQFQIATVKIQEIKFQELENTIKQIIQNCFSDAQEKQLFLSLCLISSQHYLDIMDYLNRVAPKENRQSSRIDLLLMNIIDTYKNQKYSNLEQNLLTTEIEKIKSNQNDKIDKVMPQVKQVFELIHSSNNNQECIQIVKNVFLPQTINHIQKMRCFLRLIADGKRQDVYKNFQVFKNALEEFQDSLSWIQPLRQAWGMEFEYLSSQSSDLKHLIDIIAELLRFAIDCSKQTIQSYYIPTEDQDELEFMTAIANKLYRQSKTLTQN